MKNLLPLGTVVKLKNADKLVMITGFLCKSEDKSSDYSGCIYPEGIVDSNINLFFNNDDIEKIIYNGLSDMEDIVFKKQLEGLR